MVLFKTTSVLHFIFYILYSTVYNHLQIATKFTSYYLRASNGRGHGIHSPFVFDFVTKVLNDKKQHPAYDVVEALRRKLRMEREVLIVEDFGAGSGIDRSSRRTVSSIARHAAKPEKYGKLLYRMVHYYQPQTILELGTSLGITSSYLSMANPKAIMTTMEGSSAIASIASRNFRDLQLSNIKIVEGNFDTTLTGVIDKSSSLDFIFLDGNHRRDPTIRYFNSILPRINELTIVVLDDIHWSSDMEEAWNTIKTHPAVKCSIDLFFMGIIFFRKDFREQQHFTIRF